MIKVQFEYGTWPDITRTVTINAAHVEIIKKEGVFQIYVYDMAGAEHRAISTDKLLENVYVDGSVEYRRTIKKRV